MKYIITEDQLKKVKDKLLKILFSAFDNDWELLQQFLQRKGNPPYVIIDNVGLRKMQIESLGNLTSVGGYLSLYETPIKSLGNLISVGGYLNLFGTPIKSLGNLTSVGGFLNLYGTPIESLGNLTSVGGELDLRRTPIESLGNLTSVGGDLYLRGTPISKKYTEEQIRDMVEVSGKIYL